jgi:hypothetical protein
LDSESDPSSDEGPPVIAGPDSGLEDAKATIRALRVKHQKKAEELERLERLEWLLEQEIYAEQKKNYKINVE